MTGDHLTRPAANWQRQWAMIAAAHARGLVPGVDLAKLAASFADPRPDIGDMPAAFRRDGAARPAQASVPLTAGDRAEAARAKRVAEKYDAAVAKLRRTFRLDDGTLEASA